MLIKNLQLIRHTKLYNLGENCAEKIWGLLYTMKSHVHTYVKGKLPQDELYTKNRNTLRKILQIKRATETARHTLVTEPDKDLSSVLRSKSWRGITLTPRTESDK